MVLNLINNADNTSKVLDNGGNSIFAPSPAEQKNVWLSPGVIPCKVLC